MGKVIFSQVSICSHHRGKIPQSHVLSQVSGPRAFPRRIPQFCWGRYPQSWLEVCPSPKWEVPQSWGVSKSQEEGTQGLGYPKSGQDWGSPLVRTGLGYSPSQDNRVSTCYAADGMPLPVTQEDFFVYEVKLVESVF